MDFITKIKNMKLAVRGRRVSFYNCFLWVCLSNLFFFVYVLACFGDGRQCFNFDYGYIDPDSPRSVLLLTYPGCGSRVLEHLLDGFPGSTHTAQPLDSLYVSQYGTKEGGNSADDIYTWRQGGYAKQTPAEVEQVADYLHNIYTCELLRLPVEFAVHRYWDDHRDVLRSSASYVNCLDRFRLTTARDRCYRNISQSDVCSARLGQDMNRMTFCQAGMLQQGPGSQQPTQSNNVTLFDAYRRCMTQQNRLASDCRRRHMRMCGGSRLRVVSTSRASMETVERLIQITPNLQVIHLIRDPRSVFVSLANGKQNSWYGQGEPIKQAALYCRRVADDITLRHQLERTYRGAFLSVDMDVFLRNVTVGGQQLAHFLGVSAANVSEKMIPSSVVMEERLTIRRTQKQMAKQDDSMKAILRHCRTLFTNMKEWRL